MARKITTGIVGGPILGKLSTANNTLSSVETDSDVTIDPDGNGIVLVNSHLQIQNQASLQLGDADSSRYVALQAPATVTTNVTYVLPAAATDGYYLQTDTSGTLSWALPQTQITNNTTDTASYYLTMTTATSGGVGSLTVSNSKISFQPSSGNLTISGNLGGAVNGTFTGTVQAATITETSSITLKENISPIENALDSISKLVGVIYDRKDGSTKQEAGLIAEDVNQILPNLVKKDDNGNPESIMYTKLTAYLIEAVKTLKDEIVELKGKI